MQVPRIIRRVTDPLLRSIPVPVLSGVNRGRWWSLASAGSGYATGRRAHRQMRIIASLLRPQDIVWDVGAHHGYVTLCAARVAREVHAFEPSARNRAALHRHLRWNRLDNVRVHSFALSDHDGTASFGGSGTSKTFAHGKGEELVEVRRAATLVANGTCPAPTFAKTDVEGAEPDLLAGLLPVLPSSARLFIAVHGRESDERCTAILEQANFALVPSRALTQSRQGRWNGDPDLLAFGPEYAARDAEIARLRASGF